ncbi:MAG: hypothetical protein QXE64_02615 [Candidatus Pacearchaeota archaeon]
MQKRAKRAQELNIKLLIIAILVIIVVIVSAIALSSGLRQIVGNLLWKIKAALGLMNATNVAG